LPATVEVLPATVEVLPATVEVLPATVEVLPDATGVPSDGSLVSSASADVSRGSSLALSAFAGAAAGSPFVSSASAEASRGASLVLSASAEVTAGSSPVSSVSAEASPDRSRVSAASTGDITELSPGVVGDPAGLGEEASGWTARNVACKDILVPDVVVAAKASARTPHHLRLHSVIALGIAIIVFLISLLLVKHWRARVTAESMITTTSNGSSSASASPSSSVSPAPPLNPAYPERLAPEVPGPVHPSIPAIPAARAVPSRSAPASTADVVDLVIESSPAGAKVVLGDVVLGKTPFRGTVKRGASEVTIVVQMHGYADWRIVARPDKRISQRVRLNSLARPAVPQKKQQDEDESVNPFAR
jgi:hypothetical protein